MATFLELWNERRIFLNCICEASKTADQRREKEYNAVVKLQSWYRGCRVRAYIRYLNECATTIQTVYRGHYWRRKYRQRLNEHLKYLRKKHCDEMAILIQKTWRGYYVRRYIHNYYAQKQYFEALKDKNEIVRNQLHEHKERVTTEQLNREESLQKLIRAREARKYHYMLSTESSAGVFHSPQYGSLPIEDQMRSITFHQKQKNIQRRDVTSTPISTNSNFTGICIDLAASTGDCRLRHTLPTVKPKGPFRHPKEVQHQRRRPLRSSLRVDTPFDSVETARIELKAKEESRTIVEEKFLPFSKVRPHYTPMLGSQMPYSRPSYGTDHFRHDLVKRKKIEQEFQTVVSSIPIFDKLNSTY